MVLRRRSAPILLAGSFVLALASCAVPPTAHAPPTSAPTSSIPVAAVPATWQQQMLAQVNLHRSRAGVAPVVLCGRLVDAAQTHSQDQAATGVMSHVGSDGSTLGVRATRAGYVGWNALAENVAAGQRDVSSVLAAWMSSDGHRRNLLNPTYTHLGAGRADRSEAGTLYWTQKFGRGGSC